MARNIVTTDTSVYPRKIVQTVRTVETTPRWIFSSRASLRYSA
jgi:hypothetical protein